MFFVHSFIIGVFHMGPLIDRAGMQHDGRCRWLTLKRLARSRTLAITSTGCAPHQGHTFKMSVWSGVECSENALVLVSGSFDL